MGSDLYRGIPGFAGRWIVAYAWDETRFYRDWLRRHGLRPRSFQGPDDLQAIPPIDRRTVQTNHDRIIIRSKVLWQRLSGGTTGHRLRWAVSPQWQEMFMRCLYRGFGWAGLSREMRLVSFYSQVIGQAAESSLIIREAFDIDRIEQDVRRAVEFQPDAVCG